MGLIINKTIDALTVNELYQQLDIEPLAQSHPVKPLYFGGPCAPGHCFVLHSTDYRDEGTLVIDTEFAMTTTHDILRANSKGKGPRRYLVTLGYAGWAPDQLDAEIHANGWLSVAADSHLVFDVEDKHKWQRGLAKLGVSPENLSGHSGHA